MIILMLCMSEVLQKKRTHALYKCRCSALQCQGTTTSLFVVLQVFILKVYQLNIRISFSDFND